MDFWGTLLVLVRRWYVAVPAFLFAAGVTAGVYLSVPTHYASSSVLVLTAPVNGGTLASRGQATMRVNPLLEFPTGLRTTATLLVEALNTPDVAAEVLQTEGKDTTLQVINGSGNTELLQSGPYLFVIGESTSRAKALDVVTNAVALAQERLQILQDTVHVPESTAILLSEVVSPTEAEPVKTGRVRAAVSALAVGTILALAATFAAESALTGRRRRRREPVSVDFDADFSNELANDQLAGAGPGRRTRQ